jgi:hypothetical protein
MYTGINLSGEHRSMVYGSGESVLGTYRGLDEYGGDWFNDSLSSFTLDPSYGAVCSITLNDTDNLAGNSAGPFTSGPGQRYENRWLGPSNPQMNGIDFNDRVSSHKITVTYP